MARFILVYKEGNFDEERKEKLETFKSNLLQLGIELETIPFSASFFAYLFFNLFSIIKQHKISIFRQILILSS